MYRKMRQKRHNNPTNSIEEEQCIEKPRQKKLEKGKTITDPVRRHDYQEDFRKDSGREEKTVISDKASRNAWRDKKGS